MEEIAYKSVFHYIQQSPTPVSPHILSRVTGKSRVSVHMALKKLLTSGDIEKIGLSPRVTYKIKGFTPVIATDLTIEEIKQRVQPILKRYPIAYAGILGSFAENIIPAGSTLNMMVSYRDSFSVVSLIALERSLTQALGMKIDLITDQGANKYIKASMIHSLTIIYGRL